MYAPFNQHKRKLHILILGPYRPEPQLTRLEGLRNYLIAKKFQTTRLVKDFSDKKKFSNDLDEHFTQKSRFNLETWAHVPVFVFFKDSDNLGVNTELIYTCLNAPDKASHAVVLLEEGLNVGSQVKGSIKIAKISYETFENDKELYELALGHSLKILDKLYYYI